MKMTAQVSCIAAMMGAAALYCASQRRLRSRAQLGVSILDESSCSSVNLTACQDVLSKPRFVTYILDFVGPGQHLYISTISKLVHQCYAKVEARECYAVSSDLKPKRVQVTSQMTVLSKTFLSKSRLILALQSGVRLVSPTYLLRSAHYRLLLDECRPPDGVIQNESQVLLDIYNPRIQVLMGYSADRAMLEFVIETLGMPYTSKVLSGALRSGRLSTLIWLTGVLRCQLPYDSSIVAAVHGHVHVLNWLHEQQTAFAPDASVAAATQSHLKVLQFLHDNGYAWHPDTCIGAVRSGTLNVVKYACEHTTSWNLQQLTCLAARWGHIHILNWLRDCCGAVMRAELMAEAAQIGQFAMLQHLHSIECSSDAASLRLSAARGGSIPVMREIINLGLVYSAQDMTSMLYIAGAHNHLAAVEWLRQQGAVWPQFLKDWSGEVLTWARAEGCTPPVELLIPVV
jgi:hypothetical protein